MTDKTTTISVSLKTWKRLNDARRSSTESFNDVLERTELKLDNEVEEDKGENGKNKTMDN